MSAVRGALNIAAPEADAVRRATLSPKKVGKT